MENQLLAEATLALETYRRLLPPGMYHFAAELVDGEPTGKIIEEKEEFYGKAQEEEHGAVLGFWPQGSVPDHLKNRLPIDWIYRYPFLAGVSKLSQAQGSFLEILTKHVNEKISAMQIAPHQ